MTKSTDNARMGNARTDNAHHSQSRTRGAAGQNACMTRRSLVATIPVALGSAALGLAALAGCTVQDAGTGEGGDTPATAGTASSGKRTVVDSYDRKVEVSVEVRTAATVGSGARIVVYAGGQDKLIAVTEADKPASSRRPYTIVYEELFSDLPTTSNGNHLNETTVDMEALLALAPDVVVSSRSARECDALQKATGIPVVGVSYQGQIFSDGIYRAIQVAGDALGTSEHAKQVVEIMRGWAADLAKRTESIPESKRPPVYVGAVNYKGAKGFCGTYGRYPVFDAVNIRNVADETGVSGSVEVELEQIGTWAPEVMFLDAANLGLMREEYVAHKEFLDAVPAVRDGRLYTQPSFNNNGTNVELGICDAFFSGATVYPEAFADIDLEKMYDEVFETMLGAAYYDTMKSKGMDFGSLSLE